MPEQRPRQAGIREVARAAGVSTTTVSHALSGKGRVKAGTRTHIEAVARDLGYRGHGLARGLAGGTKGLLAVYISWTDGPSLVPQVDYFMELMQGAVSSALERGYWLTLAPLPTDGSAVVDLPLDGAIVADPLVRDPHLSSLLAQGVPVVATGRSLALPATGYCVDNDHAAGTRAVLDHFAEQGAASIAVITTPPEHSYIRDSLEAYRAWMGDRGLAPEIVVVTDPPVESTGYDAALQLLQPERRVDAVYATLDRLALGAMLAARTLGIDVPGDLLVAGLTDSNAARTVRPSLTTLDLHPAEVGREAVDMLIALVEGGEPAAHSRVVSTRLVKRSSSTRS